MDNRPLSFRRQLATLFFAIALAVAEVDRARPLPRPVPIVMHVRLDPLMPPRLHPKPMYRRFRKDS